MTIQTEQVLLCYEEKTSLGSINIISWSKSQRSKRCVLFWTASWVAALIAVFIPLAHFFLVPAFFILGPVLGLRQLQITKQITGGTASCPACASDLKIEKCSYKWPLEELCTNCRRNITIEPASKNQHIDC